MMNRARRLSRVPLGLVGMLGLVALVESYASTRWLDLTNPSTLSWRLADLDARGGAGRVEVLCLGDSLAKHGLIPAAIEDRIGRTSHNLAAAGAPAPATYYLLRHAIDAGARPKAIVVDFSPDILTGGPTYAARNWPEILSPRELFEISRGRDATFALRLALEKLLPSLRARHEARDWIAANFRGDANPNLVRNLAHSRNWRLNQGSEFSPPNPAFTGDVSEDDHRRLLSDAFSCHKINMAYVHRLIQLAETAGCRVYVLIPPVAPAVQERRERSGADARHAEFLRELAATYPRLVILDGRRSGYAASRFVDPIHLTGQGALVLSREVADAIAAGRAGWVELPRYRDEPPSRSYEDVQASEIAVKSRPDALRR